jgi:hypothetical protein
MAAMAFRASGCASARTHAGTVAGAMVVAPSTVSPSGMRFGNVEVCSLVGRLGCLFMVWFRS